MLVQNSGGTNGRGFDKRANVYAFKTRERGPPGSREGWVGDAFWDRPPAGRAREEGVREGEASACCRHRHLCPRPRGQGTPGPHRILSQERQEQSHPAAGDGTTEACGASATSDSCPPDGAAGSSVSQRDWLPVGRSRFPSHCKVTVPAASVQLAGSGAVQVQPGLQGRTLPTSPGSEN